MSTQSIGPALTAAGEVTVVGLGECDIPCWSFPHAYYHRASDGSSGTFLRDENHSRGQNPCSIVVDAYNTSTQTRIIHIPRNPPSSHALRKFGSLNSSNRLPPWMNIKCTVAVEGLSEVGSPVPITSTYRRSAGRAPGSSALILFENAVELDAHDPDRPKNIPKKHRVWRVGHLMRSADFVVSEEVRALTPPPYSEFPPPDPWTAQTAG